ncbi:MAG: hypothetical protein NTX45_16015 [Proteobacteria bacterium]|nr:hypothetical protein [Pseudomonadota bacterium]
MTITLFMHQRHQPTAFILGTRPDAQGQIGSHANPEGKANTGTIPFADKSKATPMPAVKPLRRNIIPANN